jgi:NADH-quinone oxidoreductase subunit J
MSITLQQIIFFLAAIVIVVFSIMSVTTKSILRSATYLLFVLFSTAMFYFILDYTFLGAAQIIIYAGGIMILYVFSILLTKSDRNINENIKWSKIIAILITTLIGGAVILFCIFSHKFASNYANIPNNELDMNLIGQTLMGTEKYQYVLPFEAVSILLLACMIGAIVIARKK